MSSTRQQTRKRTASELTSVNGGGGGEGTTSKAAVSASPRKKLKTGAGGRKDSVDNNSSGEHVMVVTPDLMLKPETDEEAEAGEAYNHLPGLSDWEAADLRILVESVEREAPTSDTCRFRVSLDKVDWEAVATGTGLNFSGEECKQAMNTIIQQVRTHRTLSEILTDAKVVAQNPFRSKRTGRLIHPDMPKKPPTPYFRFFGEKRVKYKEVNPWMSNLELSRFMVAEFAALSEKKRAKYRRQYDLEMDEYRRRFALFRQHHPELFKRKRKPLVTSADLGVPEKPKRPYHFYHASRLAKYADMEPKAADEAIRAAWAALPDGKRMKWIKKAVKDERRYEAEMATYRAEHPHYIPPVPVKKKKLSVLSKTEQRLKDRTEGRPDRPPTSGYILYSQQTIGELMTSAPDMPMKDKVVEIGRRWKELPDEERAKFNAKAAKAQAKFVEKFDAYLQGLPEAERAKVLAEQRLNMPSERRMLYNAQRATRAQVLASALTYYQTEELMRMSREQPRKMKGELIQGINRRWEAMTDSERQIYVDLAEAIKDFLPSEGGGNGANGGGVDTSGVGAILKQKRPRKKAAVNPAEVEYIAKSGVRRPPKNGFTLFMRECAADYADLSPTEKMRQMAAVWKGQFTAEKRQEWVERCRQMMDDFRALVRRYEETGEIETLESAAAAAEVAESGNRSPSKNKQSSLLNKTDPPKSPTKSASNSAAVGNNTTTISLSSSPRKTAAASSAASSAAAAAAILGKAGNRNNNAGSSDFIYKVSASEDSDSDSD